MVWSISKKLWFDTVKYFLWGAKEKFYAENSEKIESLKTNIRDAIVVVRTHILERGMSC